MSGDRIAIRHRMGTWVRQHRRAAGIGVSISALLLFGLAVTLAWAIVNGVRLPGAADATPSSMAAGPTADPSNSPSLTASPAASPTSTPATASSGSFHLLAAEQPPDFVPGIACDGPIGESDPVAIAELRAAADGSGGDVVLRDYADPANPRTACQLQRIEQLIDSRHLVIPGRPWAVVDLPEVRYHWFDLPPNTDDSYTTFLAVSPGLDEVLWRENTMAENTLHLTTSAGDQVIASLRGSLGGRCGSAEDSRNAAYTSSGAHFFALDQTEIPFSSLVVVEGETVVLSVIPPSTGWTDGAWPTMAVWSPTSETLYYRQAGDVWRWTPAGGTERYLSGVTWYFPTITPDGSHLAYSVQRPDGGHNVYLIDLTLDGSPRLIGEARNLATFVNDTQLWYRSEGQGLCGPGSDKPLIYNITDHSEAPSILEWVRAVWPATSARHTW